MPKLSLDNFRFESRSRPGVLQLSLPRLRDLKLSGILADVQPFLLGPYRHMTHLDLLRGSFISPLDVHSILEHHTQLEVFSCTPVGDLGDLAPEMRITAPSLMELTVRLSGSNTHIFCTFLAPALTKLHIFCAFRFDTAPILMMIEDSGCALTSFTLSGYYSSSFDETFALIPALVELRAAGSYADIPAHTLARIAQGILLPRLEVLECPVEAPMAFVDVVEGRLKASRQGDSGIGHLREASANTTHVHAVAAARLKDLNDEYGVSFKFTH